MEIQEDLKDSSTSKKACLHFNLKYLGYPFTTHPDFMHIPETLQSLILSSDFSKTPVFIKDVN